MVSAFISYRSEIDTAPLLAAADAAGYRLCLPVVEAVGKPLTFRNWRPGDDLEPGVWGIPVPRPAAGTVEPDMVLAPLLAFDRAGYRLGYGGGFYDRTLERLRAMKPVSAAGLAYAGQEIDHVPHDDQDQRLDAVITETGIIAIEKT